MDEKTARTVKKSIFSQLGWLLGRVPFTLCMLAILLIVAWATHSYFQHLAHEWITRLGFAPRDFWLFRWERLFLSALVTQGGITFWLALLMVGLTSGITEWKGGSLRAAGVFWAVHLVTLMLESALFLLPLHRLGFPAARAVFFSRDVGPSAGYMGSLGYVITYLPKPWRWLAFSAILLFLIASLFLPPRPGQSMAIKLSDDIAHLLAFPLGWLSAYLIGRIRSQVTGGKNMPDKTIAQKLSIKPGSNLLVVNPPAGYLATIGDLPLGSRLVNAAREPVNAIQVFVANRKELEAQLPQLKRLLAAKGMLWVTYHKGTSKVKTDINRDSIVAYAQTIGMQGVAMISIDDDWASLRLKLIDT